jgi:hypothetical protein
VSHFARFTMAHLCPLGPRVRMNCSRFHGVSLDLLLFLELVYRGPQHHIYIWIWIWVESPLMVAESLSPLDRVWLCRLERWQVYLTAGCFYAKLVDASR